MFEEVSTEKLDEWKRRLTTGLKGIAIVTAVTVFTMSAFAVMALVIWGISLVSEGLAAVCAFGMLAGLMLGMGLAIEALS